ncbi:MAG: aminoacetone oxidase family FAD-binding enzyme [Butyrivibrio sp.]|jgi:predicted Rossmann fold flavoprotein|nr:aminoacetone oxidase family FAD-binding enzyme [Butyrivibrio sp.]
MQKRVLIAGAGASGMCAAICCARAGAMVTVIEKEDHAGKKLSMTGNGRCNLSNEEMQAEDYNVRAADRMQKWLGQFGTADTIAFFRSLGIVVRSEAGYLYPYSGQASSVVDVMQKEMERLGVELIFHTQIKEIIKNPEGKAYTVRTSGISYQADAVILATGGLAGPKVTASTGDGYYIAGKLGITSEKCYPALVQLLSRDDTLPQEAGVRMEAEITFRSEQQILTAEEGELQITAHGISGIPIMQASGKVAQCLAQGKAVTAEIDFFPGYDAKKFEEMIQDLLLLRKRGSIEEFLEGLCNIHVNQMILKRQKVSGTTPLQDIPEQKLKEILRSYRCICVEISGTGTYQQSQVTSGGICLDELTDELEAVKAPGVYFTGEITDVDGRCGGYNLQWAWMSGTIAGRAAAEW